MHIKIVSFFLFLEFNLVCAPYSSLCALHTVHDTFIAMLYLWFVCDQWLAGWLLSWSSDKIVRFFFALSNKTEQNIFVRMNAVQEYTKAGVWYILLFIDFLLYRQLKYELQHFDIFRIWKKKSGKHRGNCILKQQKLCGVDENWNIEFKFWGEQKKNREKNQIQAINQLLSKWNKDRSNNLGLLNVIEYGFSRENRKRDLLHRMVAQTITINW